MAETPRLDLPYIASSQAQKEIMHNISLDRLDLLVQCTVLDRNLATPPASPVLGDAYIVGPAPTGVWAGHADALALYINLQWQFIPPLPGFQCWVLDEAVQVGWSGSAWTIIASGGAGATTLLGLTDTPDTYGGQAGKTLLVNPGETGMVFGTVAGSAPVDATYIVSSANTTLSAERVVTDTSQITWDVSTAGQLKAALAVHGVALDRLPQQPPGTLLGRGGSLEVVDDVQVITVGAGLSLAGTTLSATGGGGGSSDFLGLSDTPDAYTGQAGKAVLVNAGATALEFGTASGGAPTDAEYIVGSASTPLTQARVLTTTPTVSWDLTTAGQAKAVVQDASITEAKLLLADNTTQNVSSTRHGLVPKAPNVATQFLDGTGAWSTPAGGGMTTEQVQDIVGAMVVGSTSVAFTYNDAVGTINVSLQPGGVDESHINLTDVMLDDASIFKHGFTPKLSGNSLHYLNGNGGWTTPTTTFLALTDTPDTYASNALKILRVNTGATALEFGPVLGTMATQDANAVAITGGTMSIGGHAPTGVLDVQGSVVASDLSNQYLGVRIWPIAPAGALAHQALRLEPATGSAVATSGFYGLVVTDQPVTSGNSMALYLLMAAGADRYNVYAQGTAQNYFAGNVGIGIATPGYLLHVNGEAFIGRLGIAAAPVSGFDLVTGSGDVYIGGNMGFSVNPPTKRLDVNGDTILRGLLGVGKAATGSARIHLTHDGSTFHGIIVDKTGSDSGGTSAMLLTNVSGGIVGSINSNATGTSYNTSSDRRLKHAVQNIADALDKIAALRPVTFQWNADDSQDEGFLAHELQQVIPHAVTGEPDAVNDDGTIRPQQVDHSKLLPWVVGAMQELTARLAYLETQLGM